MISEGKVPTIDSAFRLYWKFSISSVIHACTNKHKTLYAAVTNANMCSHFDCYSGESSVTSVVCYCTVGVLHLHKEPDHYPLNSWKEIVSLYEVQWRHRNRVPVSFLSSWNGTNVTFVHTFPFIVKQGSEKIALIWIL